MTTVLIGDRGRPREKAEDGGTGVALWLHATEGRGLPRSLSAGADPASSQKELVPPHLSSEFCPRWGQWTAGQDVPCLPWAAAGLTVSSFCSSGLLTNAALRGSRSGLGSLESPHLDPGPQPSVDYACSLHPATVSRGPSRTASVLSILSLTDQTQEGRTWTHRWRRWAQAIQGCGARPCPPLPATLLGAGGRGWG